MPFALTFSGNDKHLLHSCDHIVIIFSQYWYCQIWSEPFYLVGGCRSSYILYAWTIRGTVLQFQSYHRYKLTCCWWLRGIDRHFDCILLNKIMSDIVVQTIFLIQSSIGSSSIYFTGIRIFVVPWLLCRYPILKLFFITTGFTINKSILHISKPFNLSFILSPSIYQV